MFAFFFFYKIQMFMNNLHILILTFSIDKIRKREHLSTVYCLHQQVYCWYTHCTALYYYCRKFFGTKPSFVIINSNKQRYYYNTSATFYFYYTYYNITIIFPVVAATVGRNQLDRLSRFIHRLSPPPRRRAWH